MANLPQSKLSKKQRAEKAANQAKREAIARGEVHYPKRPSGFQHGNVPATAGQEVARKMVRDIKEGIIDAATAQGRDGNGAGGLTGYLEMLAKDYPKQFTSLLARVVPLQISGSVSAFVGAVNIVAVPSDRYLSADDVKRMTPQDTEGDGIVIDQLPDRGEDAA